VRSGRIYEESPATAEPNSQAKASISETKRSA
jgi:hypothetical protein